MIDTDAYSTLTNVRALTHCTENVHCPSIILHATVGLLRARGEKTHIGEMNTDSELCVSVHHPYQSVQCVCVCVCV